MTKPDMRVSGLYDGILLEQETRDKFLRGETGWVMGLPPLGPAAFFCPVAPALIVLLA